MNRNDVFPTPIIDRYLIDEMGFKEEFHYFTGTVAFESDDLYVELFKTDNYYDANLYLCRKDSDGVLDMNFTARDEDAVVDVLKIILENMKLICHSVLDLL